MAKRHIELFLALCFMFGACADSPASRSIGVSDATPYLRAGAAGGEGLTLRR